MKEKFISGRNNGFIIEISKLKQKKHRNQTGLFYVEGVKLLREALDSAYRDKIRYIICTEGIALPPSLRDTPLVNEGGFEVITVTREVYKKITDEEAFEGIMCVIEKPDKHIILPYKKPVIILSSVRDPGNVGTIIRTADAIGDIDMILSEDCADIYSGKTQRAAMGAVFRQSIKISEDIKQDIENLRENGYNILAAHLDKDSRNIDEIEFNAKTAVVFGNEGGGLDDEIVKTCDGKIIIPMNPSGESLNVSVAAGIVLWEMRKIREEREE